MRFLRLRDDLLAPLFENEEIVAVDKPYGISSHTNDSKVGNADFINDGLIEIFERQLGHRLYVVHRLDQTTTGVIIFAKSPEAAKKYADFFFNRQVKKTYFFITASASASKLESGQFTIDQVIVHKAKDLEAKTNFKLLEKATGFELWQANPLTGRNHQIRIHASTARIPILGDDKYGGERFPFICLHNRRIEFPNGVVIESVPPKYFTDLSLLKDQLLVKALFEADRRTRLFRARDLSEQCFRLVHAKNESEDFGFTVDHFGKNLVLSSYSETWTPADQKTFAKFAAAVAQPIFVRLMYNRGKDPANKSQLTIGLTGGQTSVEAPRRDARENLNATTTPQSTSRPPVESVWVANENSIRYEMRSDSGQSFGLFLDQRLQRNWVRQNSKDRTVLNLFAYTCGFSVAAALGGATQVTSVDTSKNVLNWGKRNFELNGIDVEKHKFLFRDSLDVLQQGVKKEVKYDLIICDPPSFSRGEKGVFKIETAIDGLLKQCLAMLSENGDLLFSTNFENFFVDDLRKRILKAQSELRITDLEINRIQPALDFELVGETSILKSFLIRRGKKQTPTEPTPRRSDVSIDED